ncbi:MAG: hypothetical protein AAF206_19810 [Bacteroidota bacterium]
MTKTTHIVQAKRFLIRMLLFLSPLVVLLAGLEGLQRYLPSDHSVKKTQLEAKLSEIDCLILGNSHAYLGVNPAILSEGAYNLAYTAQTFVFDKFLLEKYLPQMDQLRWVIIPVSYTSFASEAKELPGDFNQSYQFAWHYGSNYGIKPLSPKRFSLVSLLSVKKAVDRSLAHYKDARPLYECDGNGWWIGEEKGRNLERNGIDSGNFHDFYYQEKHITTNIQRLTDMISLCKSKNVQPLLVSMPMWRSYLEHIRPERMAHTISLADSIAGAHGVDYLNFTDDKQFVAEDFFDANHLGVSGARKMSNILRDFMNQQSTAVQ